MIRRSTFLAPTFWCAGLLISPTVSGQTTAAGAAASPSAGNAQPASATAPSATAPSATAPSATAAPTESTESAPVAETPSTTEPPPPVEGPATVETAPVPAEASTPPAEEGQYASAPSDAALVAQHKEQPPLLLVAMWDVSLPLGATADFAGPISGRGFALDLRYWGFGKFGIGGSFVWDTMSQKGMNEYTVGNATLSGVAVKELDSNVFVGKLYASPFDWKAAHGEGTSAAPRKILPYAAFGFGGGRMVRRVDAGVDRYTDESWQWVFAPEIGAEAPTRWGAWTVALRFNYVAGSSDAPEQMFMNLGLGAGF